MGKVKFVAVARFDSLSGYKMEYKVLLGHKVKVYGDSFYVELRQYRPDYYQLVDVYSNCEHDRGIPYNNIEEAIRGFESVCGVVLTEEMKNYLSG